MSSTIFPIIWNYTVKYLLWNYNILELKDWWEFTHFIGR